MFRRCAPPPVVLGQALLGPRPTARFASPGWSELVVVVASQRKTTAAGMVVALGAARVARTGGLIEELDLAQGLRGWLGALLA